VGDPRAADRRITAPPRTPILLRRAARIASRTGAELFAVHVVKSDEIRNAPVDTSEARELVEEFEGKFQEVVDDDTASALVSFARSERGTQIVLGASRPRPPGDRRMESWKRYFATHETSTSTSSPWGENGRPTFIKDDRPSA